MFERIKSLWKGIVNMFTLTKIENVVGESVDLSPKIINKIEEWGSMLRGRASWVDDYVTSLGIEEGICREFADVATNEMDITISNDKLQEIFNKCTSGLNENIQSGLGMGSFIMRPINQTSVEYVTSDRFIPIQFDSDGKILDCILLEKKKIKESYYTRFERHSIVSGYLQITNKAYKSSQPTDIGRECGLSAVDQWAKFPKEVSYPGMGKMDLGFYRNPIKNKWDGSHVGISIFDSAINLIRKADIQGARLDWEFESGERLIHVDARAINQKGKVSHLNKRLYKGLNLDTGEKSELYKEYSPEFRDINIINGLEEYYRQIEFSVGLAYGDLSSCQNVDKTATEIKSAKQRKYNRVTAIQENLKECLLGFIDALAFYNGLYTSGYDVSCVFNDSILTDEEAERKTDREDVAMGVMSGWEYRMKWYGEDEETAKANMPEQNNVMV